MYTQHAYSRGHNIAQATRQPGHSMSDSRSRSPSPRGGRGRSRSRSASPMKESRSASPKRDEEVDVLKISNDDAAFVLGRNGKTKEKIARVSGARIDLFEHSLSLARRLPPPARARVPDRDPARSALRCAGDPRLERRAPPRAQVRRMRDGPARGPGHDRGR